MKVEHEAGRTQRTVFEEAVALHTAGNSTAAATMYRAVLKADPEHLGALQNFGLLQLHAGHHGEAVKLLRRAVRRDPDMAVLRRDLARALMAAGEPRAAAATYREAVRLAPSDAVSHCNLAGVLHTLGRRGEAIAHYREAIALKPDFADAHNDLGVALRELERAQEALAAFRRAAALNPSAGAIQSNLAGMLIEKGDIPSVVEAYEAAVALEPRQPLYLYHLAEAKKFTADDPHLVLMTELARDAESLSSRDLTALQFALGKVYTDIGGHRRAFGHFAQGNRIRRQEESYDEAETLADLERIQTAFPQTLMDGLVGEGYPSPLPVFIVGMPRSGSTLVAQILSSHGKVFGAGEVDAFGRAVASHPRAKSSRRQAAQISDVVPGLTAEAVKVMGRRYIDSLAALAPSAERIVDKYLPNFTSLGLIHLALPKARIIHIRRDPVDTCVSCFSKLFAGAYPYAYDLAELGRYYRAYERVMEHWRGVLPAHAMLEVSYEAVVADLEGQARRMIEYCGLEWDPSCLRFNETQGWVRTSSVVQVRRALYDSSVGRSHVYGELLTPLHDALNGD